MAPQVPQAVREAVQMVSDHPLPPCLACIALHGHVSDILGTHHRWRMVWRQSARGKLVASLEVRQEYRTFEKGGWSSEGCW